MGVKLGEWNIGTHIIPAAYWCTKKRWREGNHNDTMEQPNEPSSMLLHHVRKMSRASMCFSDLVSFPCWPHGFLHVKHWAVPLCHIVSSANSVYLLGMVWLHLVIVFIANGTETVWPSTRWGHGPGSHYSSALGVNDIFNLIALFQTITYYLPFNFKSTA